jgi:hypothetical protein
MTFVSLTVIGEEASDCHRLCDLTWNICRGNVSLVMLALVLVFRNARRSANGNRRQ